jgi:hypothetical protein
LNLEFHSHAFAFEIALTFKEGGNIPLGVAIAGMVPLHGTIIVRASTIMNGKVVRANGQFHLLCGFISESILIGRSEGKDA